MPNCSCRKRLCWTAVLILSAAAIAIVLGLANNEAPKVPVEAFSIAGYTNDQAFRVVILVTNPLSFPLECAVNSYPRSSPEVERVYYEPYSPDDKINSRNLPQTVKWVEVLWGDKPEYYMPGYMVNSEDNGQRTRTEIDALKMTSFSTRLFPTNETLVVIQYRTLPSSFQKSRMAVAKWINISQSRMLNRRRWINFRTYDDRPYRIATTIFPPVMTNQPAPMDQ